MKELPMEIEINGITYYSSLELASRELDWYNLGVRIGKEEGYKDGLTWADAQYGPDYMKGYEDGKKQQYIPLDVIDNHYQKGYDEGYKKGIEDGKLETKNHTFTDKELEPEGHNDGYELGKKFQEYNGISEIKLHTDMNHLHHLWYDKGYNAGKSEEAFDKGYAEGYKECREVAKILSKYGKLKQMPEHFAESKDGKTKPKDILERIFGKKE